MSKVRSIENFRITRELTTKDTESTGRLENFSESFGLFTFNKQKTNAGKSADQRHNFYLNIPKTHKTIRKMTIDQKIKEKEIENQAIIEKIKEAQIDIKNKIHEEKIAKTKIIQKKQTKIEALQESLNVLMMKKEGLVEKLRDNKRIEKIQAENWKLKKKIGKIQEKINEQKISSIPSEQSSKLSENLKILEESQYSTVQNNLELAKKLAEIKEKNYLKCLSLVSDKDRDNLVDVYYQISKIRSITAKISRKEIVKLSEIVLAPYEQLYYTPAQLVNLIKKETHDIKISISDIYAEQYGNLCQTY